jgi:hypothetical protein
MVSTYDTDKPLKQITELETYQSHLYVSVTNLVCSKIETHVSTSVGLCLNRINVK